MTPQLDPDVFAPTVGSQFIVTLQADVAPVELVLVEVVEHPASPGAPRERPFTLCFLGPTGEHFRQGLYSFSHAGLGTIDIFIVPLGPQADGRHRYEAVFN